MASSNKSSYKLMEDLNLRPSITFECGLNLAERGLCFGDQDYQPSEEQQIRAVYALARHEKVMWRARIDFFKEVNDMMEDTDPGLSKHNSATMYPPGHDFNVEFAQSLNAKGWPSPSEDNGSLADQQAARSRFLRYMNSLSWHGLEHSRAWDNYENAKRRFSQARKAMDQWNSKYPQARETRDHADHDNDYDYNSNSNSDVDANDEHDSVHSRDSVSSRVTVPAGAGTRIIIEATISNKRPRDRRQHRRHSQVTELPNPTPFPEPAPEPDHPRPAPLPPSPYPPN